MEIRYSAPAKVILSGEHGVVYGKPALAAAINVRLECTASHSGVRQNQNIRFILETVKAYLLKKNYKLRSSDPVLKISSQIPSSRGLGSSAAYAVASSAAAFEWYTGQVADKQLINDIAYRIEKRFHTNPSGVDVSASCHGGLIYYRKEFEFLKTISALSIKIPKPIEDNLYLIDSGKPVERTAEMVGLVGRRYNKEPEATRSIFEQMERVTKRMVVSLVKEDVRMFTSCVSENQRLLHQVGVVSKSATGLLQELQKFGTGKITGAGGVSRGSGYILFLAANTTGLEEYLSKRTIGFMKFEQDYEGLKREVAATA